MVANSNLLSPEEIDALSQGIQDGSLETDTGYNKTAKVRKHDLAQEDSTLGINVTSLDMINERFIRLFRLGLMEALRTSPRMIPQNVQLKKFGDYLSERLPPLSVNVIRLNPLRGQSMIIIDRNMIFNSLENFFGGVGKPAAAAPPGRPFTPTENRVIEMILQTFFNAMTEAWEPIMKIEFEKVSAEINPNFAQIADENDLVIICHFEAESGDSKGYIDIVYPYATLKPIRDLLRGRVQSTAGDDESDRKWSQDIEQAVCDSALKAQVMLGEVHLTLQQLNEMNVGEVLFFKKEKNARMVINEVPAFDCRVGTAGPNLAVQIQSVILPEEK
jgi:flagellar motor switch protein FliM